MAADTVREECDERTGEYRENEAGEDHDPLRSVGRCWKRGRRGRRATFSPVFVSGEKPFEIAPSQMPVWRPFRDVAPAYLKTVLSGLKDSSIHRPFAQNTRGRTWKTAAKDRCHIYFRSDDLKLFINLSSITGVVGDRKAGSLRGFD
jgi:hypothetical protein